MQDGRSAQAVTSSPVKTGDHFRFTLPILLIICGSGLMVYAMAGRRRGKMRHGIEILR
jgi:hypothetical protein